MTRRDISDLRNENTDPGFRSMLSEAISVRAFFNLGVRHRTFRVPDHLTEAIKLTPAGSKLLKDAQLADSSLSAAERHFVLFLLFSHADLFVDVANLQFAALWEFLRQSIADGTLQLPWLFDQVLYDRAFEILPERPKRLNQSQTLALLAETPVGVFQMREFVSGPFGILISREQRYFSPRLRLLLWHCPDAMCNAIHVGDLTQLDSKFDSLRADIRSELNSHVNMSSWITFGTELVAPDDHYDDLSLCNLPWLIGNGFSQSECITILAGIIDVHDRSIRQRLPKGLTGSTSEITRNLTKPQAVQLLLLARSEDIVASIDDALEKRHIVIPPTEVRSESPSAPNATWLGAYCECSDLGVRVVVPAKTTTMALARLRRLVLAVYSSDHDRETLQWRLRGLPGATLGQRLEHYISENEPHNILKDLLFIAPDKLRAATNHLRCPHFKMPALGEDSHFLERMLWKLVFPKTRFESVVQSFYITIQNLRSVSGLENANTEQERAAIRSAGVNLFVSLEEVLEATLGFCTWLFLADHPAEEHAYNSRAGRKLVSEQLSGIISTPEGSVTYETDGRNTLFPLVVGFLALVKRIEELFEHPSRDLKAPVLLAHYEGKTQLQLYPYKHRHFVLDAAGDERSACLAVLRFVGEKFQQALPIRNKIDHKASTFPSANEIEKCCDLLQQGVESLEKLGLVPCIYATTLHLEDSYGRSKVTSINYAGKKCEWNRSPALRLIRSLPTVFEAQLLVPCLHVPDTDEIVRFSVREESEYTRQWANYPKRRSPTVADIVEKSEEAGSLEPQAEEIHRLTETSSPRAVNSV